MYKAANLNGGGKRGTRPQSGLTHGAGGSRSGGRNRCSPEQRGGKEGRHAGQGCVPLESGCGAVRRPGSASRNPVQTETKNRMKTEDWLPVIPKLGGREACGGRRVLAEWPRTHGGLRGAGTGSELAGKKKSLIATLHTSSVSSTWRSVR